ncbi:MAG TPA: GGDEF domain-containing protein [Euzebya sp.]|nr:GGDEF domain-containing protein [Euzebya sp.]
MTWDRPERPALVLLAVVLALIAGGTLAFAGPLSRSKVRWKLGVGTILLQLALLAALSYLDGGVASPLGALVYLSLPFIAITVPMRLFVPFAGYAAALYTIVAVVGGPAPPGHAYGFTIAFLGVGMLCAAHTQSLSSLRRRLTEVARIDPLTASLNRRGFDERVRDEIGRIQRTGGAFSVVLVDLDSFKAVNDAYGHQAGDTLLIWTTDTLRRGARPADDVARTGGDEFAVLLRGADAAGAAAFVRRLRVTLDGTSPASLGAATFPDEVSTADDLLHLADERMYVDKQLRSAKPAITRQPPTPRAVRKGCGPISGLDRRRRAIADGGYVAGANWVMAIVYILFLAGEGTPQGHLLMIAGGGLVIGALMVALAGLVARSRAVNGLLYGYTAVQIALVVAATALDGGLVSPIALGLLAPMSLIALTSPLRLAVPACVAMAGSYVGLGALVGTPSGWYAAMNLVGVLAIATICAVAGHTAAQQRKLLTTRSQIDWVTDCLNRRGFEQRFAREIRCARPEDHPLSLLIVDLDRFKQLNDTQGHAAGDELLHWVGTTIGRLLTEEVMGRAVGRLGGDEFVALIIDQDPGDAPAVVELVRTTLSLRTGVSVGLATRGVHGDNFDDLYRHADAMLYAEKAIKKGIAPDPTQDAASAARCDTHPPVPTTSHGAIAARR